MVTRIAAEDARQKVQAGEALLVCAYDSDDKFNQMPLEGGVSLSDFREHYQTGSRDREIIFYCA